MADLFTDQVMAHPFVVLREEFDDWAVLFNAESGDAFGIPPSAVLVWKCLDGKHPISAIVDEIREAFDEVPEDIDSEVSNFVRELVDRGFAGRALAAS